MSLELTDFNKTISRDEKNFRKTGHKGRYQLEEFSIPIPNDDCLLYGVNCRPTNGDLSYYVHEEIKNKDQIVLHATGGAMPGDIVNLTRPGIRVSSSYIIARDGTIYNLFPPSMWSYHLGRGAIGGNKTMSSKSISIELSNIGPLEEYGERLISKSLGSMFQYCKLDEESLYQKLEEPFRGEQYFATFENRQYVNLILLLRYLTNYYHIPREFLDEGERYKDTEKVKEFKGILTHVNFRASGKWDIGPAFDWKKVIDGVQAKKFKKESEKEPSFSKKQKSLSFFDWDEIKEQEETLAPRGSNKNYSIQTFRRKKHTGAAVPNFRRLKGYAFDPSLSIELETSFINEITFQIEWEGYDQAPLEPGPRGEYIEVIDYDPASQAFYEPVDLNAPYILARDGLDPAEGNPQFHQQMVYAVSMTTIENFERALGRWALWAPHKEKNGEELFVKRLRIFPHALRQANAFYSSQKIALLFGYFPANPSSSDIHIPGGTVFTCLSHDVIAHETAHALLDGMYQGLIDPIHPDNLAFHEAFADIVALFQHFTFPQVLEHQIAKTRGDLSSESLLGQLAQQVGLAIGNYGALRSAIGSKIKDPESNDPKKKKWVLKVPDPQDYIRTIQPHDRGAILVGAVFDAFLSIYNKRVADFRRIASEGTGILRAGELHPDLVSRLAKEASKTAQHILNICIRALDYCPPNEISFGDYLRALITADYDLVPDDPWGYRVAFIEAFKRRGIYPGNVRSLSVDSLRWKMPQELSFSDTSLAGHGETLQEVIVELQETILKGSLASSREKVFEFNKELARRLKSLINERLRDDTWFHEVSGLQLRPEQKNYSKSSLEKEGYTLDENNNIDFRVHAVRLSTRTGPTGNTLDQLILNITQERKGILEQGLIFRGGATLIIDWKNSQLKYVIKRKINDGQRIKDQNEYLTSRSGLSLRETYFSRSTTDEPFMALHSKTK